MPHIRVCTLSLWESSGILARRLRTQGSHRQGFPRKKDSPQHIPEPRHTCVRRQRTQITANDLNNVIATSAFRSPEFVKGYGVEIIDGPLKGLLARAVIILDENRNVIYRELVEEITKEPDYEAALKMLWL